MPVDDFGNRAEVIIDPFASISRSIIGRSYEPKVNACFRDLAKRIKVQLNITSDKVTKEYLTALNMDGQVTKLFDHVLGFYKIVSPKQYSWYENVSDEIKLEELAHILSGSRVIYFPANNQVNYIDMVEALNKHYPNDISPVTYRGNSGEIRRTKTNVLVSSMYILALDKPGEDWAAVNSGRLQHYGVLAQINDSNKFASRVRLQPPRVFGETEFRNLVANTSKFVAAEIMDRNNNRESMEMVVEAQLYAESASQIKRSIDRKKHPYGKARPIQIVTHEAGCYGYNFVYQPYKPTNKPSEK